MKRLFLFSCCLLSILMAEAKLSVSTQTDGTVVLNVNVTGDIGAEFTGSYGASTLISGSVLSGVMTTATSIKVVTASGATLSSADILRLCGEDWGSYQHFTSLTTLDLSDANVSNQSDLKNFANLTSMKKITFPATTTSIADGTFLSSSKSRIEEVIIPDNPLINLSLGNQAFQTNSLKRITIGARNTINVGSLCFSGDTNLTTVDFRFGSTSIVIGNMAFDGTTSLANIILPEGVTEIGTSAFLRSGVQSIRLPNSLKYIRKNAFSGCSQLRSITIPENVLQIETAVFENNYNLSDVYVLGSSTKCADGAFTDNETYGYHLDTYTNGQTGVNVSSYTKTDGSMLTHTVLHVLSSAYDTYVNDYLKVIGTTSFSTSAYKDHPELNHWVYDANGNKLPVVSSSYFEGTTGDYAGWKNFMLVDGKLDNGIFTDDTRIRDKWYTMCLPFDMTSDQLKSGYGSAVQVMEFSGVQISQDATLGKVIILQFKNPVTTTKAHHPYMIHPYMHSGTVTGIKTTIAGITKQTESQSNLDNQKTVITASDGIVYTFIGNYAPDAGMKQYSYYYYSKDDVSQWPNGFYKWTASTGGSWSPYTACVLLNKDNGASSKPSMLVYDDPGDLITGITPLPAEMNESSNKADNNNIYNMSGQVVRSNSSSLEGLPKGIYIYKGKKIVIFK